MPKSHTQSDAVHKFDPHRVRPLPGQPRQRFSGIRELADSIDEVGQRQPGEVTLVNDDPEFDAQLVDGERRLRACRTIGVKFRAVVVEEGDLEKLFALSFASNFGRQDHDPIEIANALHRMNNAGGKSQEQIAKIAGRSLLWVNQHLQLLNLHPSVQKMMIGQEGEKPHLTFTNGYELSRLPETEQIRLSKRIAKGMNYHQVRAHVEKHLRKTGKWKEGSHPKSLPRLCDLLDTFGSQFNRYIDLPGPELEAAIDAAPPRALQTLIEQLSDLQLNAKGLAKAIERRRSAKAA